MKRLGLSFIAFCSISACEKGPNFELTTPEPMNLDAGHLGALDASTHDAAAHDAALDAARSDTGLTSLPRVFEEAPPDDDRPYDDEP